MTKTQHGKKALIIGIDGVPCSLLDSLIHSGVMPELRRILSDGFVLHQHECVDPRRLLGIVDLVRHGDQPRGARHLRIYGTPSPTTLSPFPNANDIRAPRFFWDILGKTERQTSTFSGRHSTKIEAPRTSIVLNVPHSYPASPIRGILVSGSVALDLKKATFPEAAYNYLRSIEYSIDVDAEKAKEDKGQFMDEIFACFETRRTAISHFFAEEPWDLFLACVTETDRLHHFFFEAAGDQAHPYHEPFLEFYRGLDKFIRYLYDRFMERYPEGFFMLLSDHGFTPIKSEVYLNPFLHKTGFLNLKQDGRYYQRIAGRNTGLRSSRPRPDLHQLQGHLSQGRGYERRKGKTGCSPKSERLWQPSKVREASPSWTGSVRERNSIGGRMRLRPLIWSVYPETDMTSKAESKKRIFWAEASSRACIRGMTPSASCRRASAWKENHRSSTWPIICWAILSRNYRCKRNKSFVVKGLVPVVLRP